MERGLLISGATREKLTQGDMANAQMPDLALDVQSEVSVNLRRSRDGARQVVERLNRQIELLQEHKQALITAAVTGELDIPGIAA
jgi:type I restriction enzyme S subunit